MTDPEKIRILSQALEDIAVWFGKFPDTGETYPNGNPVSYGAQFGSNGERDFMRRKASTALEAAGLERPDRAPPG